MKISAKLEVSESEGHYIFDLDELGITEQEWNKKSKFEKYVIVKNAVFNLPEHPYWMLDSFEEM